MNSDRIDPKLNEDCYVLGKLDNCDLLLFNNALFPWFILVPEASSAEFHRLERTQQQLLLEHINQISRFIEEHFDISKLNTACIGNIVRQLHIHIVGRHESDPAWPGVVWGHSKKQVYQMSEVERISTLLQQTPGLSFNAFALQVKP